MILDKNINYYIIINNEEEFNIILEFLDSFAIASNSPYISRDYTTSYNSVNAGNSSLLHTCILHYSKNHSKWEWCWANHTSHNSKQLSINDIMKSFSLESRLKQLFNNPDIVISVANIKENIKMIKLLHLLGFKRNGGKSYDDLDYPHLLYEELLKGDKSFRPYYGTLGNVTAFRQEGKTIIFFKDILKYIEYEIL